MTDTRTHRSNLATTVAKEWDATLRRTEKNVRADLDSIATAIDKGGFLGGAVQTVDVFSVGHQTANLLENFRVIGSDPAVKEGVSGAVNLLSGNHLLALKDAADLIGALGASGASSASSAAPAPAPSQSAPSPSQAPATGQGYPVRGGSGGNVVENQRACLGELQKLQGAFEDLRLQYREWKKANPDVAEPTDGCHTMGEIIEGDFSAHEKSVRLVAMIIREHPEILEEAGVVPPGEGRASIPANEVPGQEPAPQAPAAGGDFLSMLGQTFGPLMQMLGPVAQVLGGVLASPIGIGLLEAACAAIPGAQVLLPFIPFIAPAAGMLLSGAGTMMSGGATPGSPGGAPGQAAPGFDLNALIGGISGLLGGVGGVAGAPAPAPVAVGA